MIQAHLLLFDLAFFLNNASVWGPNEGNLKPVLHAYMQTQPLIMQICLKGFSFTVMEKLLLFWESLKLWGNSRHLITCEFNRMFL